ncbi:15764_t:CDS:1, partial [Entrophospora sp. SA101]
VFGCGGYIDFYVYKLDWAIEMDGNDIAKHHRRFEPTEECKDIVR